MRGGLALQVVCSGVAWLVDRQLSAARQFYRGEQTPSLVADELGDRDTYGGQLCKRLLDVVAHQVELVLLEPVSGVDGDLGGRQLEDQPATAGVDPAKSEHVTDEGPVGFRVGAVENDMCSVDHIFPSLSCLRLCFGWYAVLYWRACYYPRPYHTIPSSKRKDNEL